MHRSSLLVLVLPLALGAAAEAQATLRPGTPQPGPIVDPRVRVAPSPRTEPAPGPGRVRCEALENGAAAPATIELRRGQELVASGSCGAPIQVPAGTYEAAVTLEGALDRPTQRVTVAVLSGGEAVARASFETAILEVRFTYQRQPVSGLAIVRRQGREIGTLGSGVSARLSAGSYEIVARYRTIERTYEVTLAPGSRRALRADL